jgi:hypothetical protein
MACLRNWGWRSSRNLCAQEPQAIYNRDKTVATLVDADQFEAFEAWRALQSVPPLLTQFREVGLALIKEGFDELPGQDRATLERPNAFLEMLESEFPMNLKGL